MNYSYNNNNNNEYIINLYNKVFNNIYIKKIIFNHLNIFNVLLPFNIQFKSIKELNQFKYKEYLNQVTISKLNDIPNDLSQLPPNIKIIDIPTDGTYINEIINSIPNHIESFKFIKSIQPNVLDSITMDTLNSKSLSKLNSLSLWGYNQEPSILRIPKSISKLTVYGSDIILTNGLQLLFYDHESSSVEEESLPASLTSAIFCDLINPLIINQLPMNGLIKLEVDCDQDIQSNIRFPRTLQDLTITRINSFNATLPSNLKLFFIDMTNFDYEIQLPSSLEELYFYFNNTIFDQDEISRYYQSFPVHLKSLSIRCSSIVDNNRKSILPSALETLYLYNFNQEITENQLPSSLTHLSLAKQFNQVIGVNVLPSNLKILELFDEFYSQPINPLAIPQQLKLLKISSDNYSHPIHLPSSTHPNTIIDCHSLDLYYNPSSNTDIRSLKLPHYYHESLSTLQLGDKSNLNYLHLGFYFNHPIQLSDLPTNNQIKILELSFKFKHTINLEYFQNLESIIINDSLSDNKNSFKIITTSIDNNGIYNYYNLKSIQISKSNIQFIKHLDINFYKFIIINQIKNK